MKQPAPCALVVTIGPPHGQPWWWEQLDGSPWRDAIEYRRISIGDRTHAQLGLKQLPALIRRTWALLRYARRNDVRYIFTFEADLTCYLIGLLQYLPWLSGPRHVILQFITREHDATFASRCKDWVARICLRTVHKVIVSARQEAAYYLQRFRWPGGKVAFVPFHTDRQFLRQPAAEPVAAIVAAGRSYRDYTTLAAAVAGTGIRTIIVCGKRGPGVDNLPPEVEVVSEIPLPKLIELMAAARAAILPLEPKRISTGQTVLLQAMALGKAVIATRTSGTEDYIKQNANGILVPPQDPAALREAIQKIWRDPSLANALGASARAAVSTIHLPAHYVAAVADALGCTTPGRPRG